MLKVFKKHTKNQKGMTLVELLAVVVILGIIAAVAIIAINNVIDNSRRDAIRSDAIQLINAANLYKSERGDLPKNIEDLSDYVELSNEWKDAAGDGENTFTTKGGKTAISAVGSNDKVSITFKKATIQEINNADKKATTIGN